MRKEKTLYESGIRVQLNAQAEKMGAKVLLDGRKAKVPSEYNSGYWIGPTILDYVNPDWACATDEIFGPEITPRFFLLIFIFSKI